MGSYKELIEQARKLETTDEKIELLFQYLIGSTFDEDGKEVKNVEYNYLSDVISLLYRDYDGIMELYDGLEDADPKVTPKQKMIDFILIETQKRLDMIFEDTAIKQQYIDKLASKLSKVELSTPMQMLAETQVIRKEEQDGLLKLGNSEEILDFMWDYCNDLNIPVNVISGFTSSIPHRWLLVMYEGGQQYHIDPTSALFIRDSAYHLNGRQYDYKKMNLSDIMSMDKSVKIVKINGKELEEPITKDNYSQEYDENRVSRNK